MVAVHCARTRVVRGQCEGKIILVTLQKLVEIRRSTGNVLVGTKGIRNAESSRGGGHQLHKALRPRTGYGVHTAAAFGVNHCSQKLFVDVVSVSGGVQILAHLLLIRLRSVLRRGHRDGCRYKEKCRRIRQGIYARDISEAEVLVVVITL